MKSIIIRNAHVIDPASDFDGIADILISDGKIQAVGEHLTAHADISINGCGLIAAPGLVDMHVHLRDPGLTHKEDILSGCRAAAAGGVTSLLAMPNSDPTADSGEVVSYILEKAKGADAHVYAAGAISKGLAGTVPTDFVELKNAGAIALSDDGRPVEDTRILENALKSSESLGLTVTAHCEDLFLAKGGIMNAGAVSRQLGIPGIPASAEDCGTARELAAALSNNAPIHICHVSTALSIELIRAAKRIGKKITAETCPHYFAMTEERLLSRDADFRMNPPLRTEADRIAVINGLADGTLDVIATDHAPHTPEEKSDFLLAPNGAIGMETSLAAGITWLVQPGLLTLSDLILKMSAIPARILNIPAGNLSSGLPADVILFDPKEQWTVDTDKLHGKSKNTPFKGQQLYGRVHLTICGGRIVFDRRAGHV